MLEKCNNCKIVTIMAVQFLASICLLFLVSSCSAFRLSKLNQENDQNIFEIDGLSGTRTALNDNSEAVYRDEDKKEDQLQTGEKYTPLSLAAEEFCNKYPLQCSLVDQVNLSECERLELATNPERVICVPFPSSPLHNFRADLQSYINRLISFEYERAAAQTINQQRRNYQQQQQYLQTMGDSEQYRDYRAPVLNDDAKNNIFREAAAASTMRTNRADDQDKQFILMDRNASLASTTGRADKSNDELDDRSVASQTSLLRTLMGDNSQGAGQDRLRINAWAAGASNGQKRSAKVSQHKQARYSNTYLVPFEEAKRFVQAERLRRQQLATNSGLPSSSRQASTTTEIAGAAASATRTMAGSSLDSKNSGDGGGGCGLTARQHSMRLHRCGQAVVVPKRNSLSSRVNPKSASAISGDGEQDKSNPKLSDSTRTGGTTTTTSNNDDDDNSNNNRYKIDQKGSPTGSGLNSTNGAVAVATRPTTDETATITTTMTTTTATATTTSGVDSSDANEMHCNMRYYRYTATMRDDLGNTCSGQVRTRICYGGCDTGEIADWLFPYKKSIHKVCTHGGRHRRKVTLTDCWPDNSIVMEHYVVDALDCVCKKCNSVDTTCLGTMSAAPHLKTIGELIGEIDQQQGSGGGGGGGDD